MADKPPARVPGHVMKLPSPPATSKPEVSGAASLPQALNEDAVKDLDEECYDRFIKVCAQCISEGFVSGLIVFCSAWWWWLWCGDVCACACVSVCACACMRACMCVCVCIFFQCLSFFP